MALQVWLPLNGDLTNQGLSNVTVTNNGATVNDSGKIGKCYSFNGSNYLSMPYSAWSKMGGQNSFSICFWVLVNSVSKRNIILGDYSLPGASNINIEINSSAYLDGSLRFYWNGSPDLKLCVGKFTTSNTWYHVVITYENAILKSYVNGVLIDTKSQALTEKTRSSGNWNIGADTRTNNTSMTLDGKLNDFRIYNHCLSPKEVKELSKGLVLHYKLAGPGQENLMPNSLNMELGTSNASTGVWRLAGSNTMTRARVKIDDSPIGQCYGLQNSGQQTNTGDASCYGIDNFPRENGVTYTASFYARTTVANTTAQAGFAFYSATYVSGTDTKNWAAYYMTEINNSWKRCVYTFISTSTSNNIYIGIGTNGVNTTTQICGFKLEKGSVTTPWVPNAADALYTTLGYNNNIEYDCSGFGYNGTKSGTIEYNSDAIRYTTSTLLSASNGAIQLGNLSLIIPEGLFTFNIWFKKETDKWSTKNWETILGGPSGFEVEAKMSSANIAYIHPYNWGGGSTSTPNSYSIAYELDKWNMLTMVRTSSNTKFYLNGELKVTGTKGSIPSGNYFLGSWNTATSQNYRGMLSDARIYATVLSDEDILELYNTSMIVDNNGNIHARELVEV